MRLPIPADVNVFFGFTNAPVTIACGEEVAREMFAAINAMLKPGLRLPGKLPVDQG
ncbi:MAG: hypothetical protein PHS96_07360 [Anaerolineales bacterium]|nr:hypothetical protein [Anaerolineales bacterium]